MTNLFDHPPVPPNVYVDPNLQGDGIYFGVPETGWTTAVLPKDRDAYHLSFLPGMVVVQDGSHQIDLVDFTILKFTDQTDTVQQLVHPSSAIAVSQIGLLGFTHDAQFYMLGT